MLQIGSEISKFYDADCSRLIALVNNWRTLSLFMNDYVSDAKREVPPPHVSFHTKHKIILLLMNLLYTNFLIICEKYNEF
jgi:hypothetical protein